MFPELIKHGAFSDDCSGAGVLTQGGCTAQVQALTGMFTLATSALNLLSMAAGAALDRMGPRLTASCAALLVAAGFVLFGAGGLGSLQVLYVAGFLLMGVAGPVIFVSSLSFPNLFPGREGLCTAALVGCFDASSAVFVGLAWLMRSGLSFEETFTGFALVPTCVALVAFSLWPREAVQKSGHMDGSQLSSGGGPPLANLPLRKQAQTAEYLLLVQNVCVGMVCLNFFIATVDLQMSRVNAKTAPALSQAFAAMLPLGGIVYVPVVGYVVDKLGSTVGLIVLWASLLSFFVLNGTYALTGAEPAAYAAFAIFSFCRPLFYTLNAAFTGETFGFATFGLLYGLLNSLAGVANCSVAPLAALAESHGFFTTNAVLLAVQFTMVALPLLVKWKDRKRPRTMSLSSSGLRFTSPTGKAFG